MRVMIVNESLSLGGAETMSVEMANTLAIVNDVFVLFVSAKGPLSECLSSNVTWHPISKFSLFKSWQVINELRRIVSEIHPDVIHAHGAAIGIMAGVSARLVDKEIKIIITHHSKVFSRVPSWLSFFLLRRYSDAFIAISRTKYQSLLMGGIPKEQIFSLPNFIDLDRLYVQQKDLPLEKLRENFALSGQSKVCVMSGRLISGKRFDRFIEILVKCASRSDFNFVGLILGDGPERSTLEDLAEKATCSNLRFIFTGYQKNIAAYLSLGNIFLFPSEHKEVLPMSLIEASGLGLPIVCSDIDGNNEIVEHEKTGFLVPPNGDYVGHVLSILSDNNLASFLSRSAVERVRSLYDKKVVVNRLVDVYESVIAKNSEI